MPAWLRTLAKDADESYLKRMNKLFEKKKALPQLLPSGYGCRRMINFEAIGLIDVAVKKRRKRMNVSSGKNPVISLKMGASRGTNFLITKS